MKMAKVLIVTFIGVEIAKRLDRTIVNMNQGHYKTIFYALSYKKTLISEVYFL